METRKKKKAGREQKTTEISASLIYPPGGGYFLFFFFHFVSFSSFQLFASQTWAERFKLNEQAQSIEQNTSMGAIKKKNLYPKSKLKSFFFPLFFLPFQSRKKKEKLKEKEPVRSLTLVRHICFHNCATSTIHVLPFAPFYFTNCRSHGQIEQYNQTECVI